jgi:hypothetical protein
MCKITNEELTKIVKRLTLRDRDPMKRTPWRQKGFAKISDARLVEYWLKRINANPEDMAMACDIVENFVRNPQQTANQPRQIVKNNSEEKNAESLTINYPPAKSMVKNLAQSMTQWVKNGFKLATEDQLKKRLEICAGCEFWDKEALGGTGRCKKCGCSTQAKLRLAHEKCPIDKWGPIDQTPLTQTS